jgi:hypothetical protein
MGCHVGVESAVEWSFFGGFLAFFVLVDDAEEDDDCAEDGFAAAPALALDEAGALDEEESLVHVAELDDEFAAAPFEHLFFALAGPSARLTVVQSSRAATRIPNREVGTFIASS